MKDKCCKNCFYLTEKPSKEFPRSEYHIKYGCSLHHLYDGEVRHPWEQLCDHWFSIKSGERNKKLESIGI